jgi:hypothetical protein
VLLSYLCSYIKARPKGRTMRASEESCPAPTGDGPPADGGRAHIPGSPAQRCGAGGPDAAPAGHGHLKRCHASLYGSRATNSALLPQ